MTVTAQKAVLAPLGFSQEDWDEVSDNPELTDEQLASLRPAAEMPAHIYAPLPKRGRGRPRSEAPKVSLTLRLDPHVVEAYKATGAGWQTRTNEVLAKAIKTQA